MKVSVVIPMYNASAWLPETLESIYRQTHARENIEIVMVDDESTDDTAEIGRRFLRDRAMNGRVVSHKSNGGCAAPRNAGWPLTQAEWIQFVDADDLLQPQKFMVQTACAATVPADVGIIYSPWQHYENVDGQWRPSGPLVASDVSDDPVVSILQDRRFGYVGPTLVRRSCLEAVNGFDSELLHGEDFDFMLRVAMAGGRFFRAFTPDPLFLYRMVPGSMWQRSIKRVGHMRQGVRISRRAELFLRERYPHGLPEHVRNALANRYVQFLDFFMGRFPEDYQETLGWILALELTSPPGLGRSLRVLSRFIGYENALELRSLYRRAKIRMQANPGA
jgi:glycosyltransferase involved in cell wall biosynthesis